MCCAYYRLWTNSIPKNTGSFIHEKKAYKNLSFDIKGLLYKEELNPCKAMNFTLSDYPI